MIDAPIYEFPNRRLVSRRLDDRIGAFTVLEALRLLAQDRPQATVAAVATSQEEVGDFVGARTAAWSFEPHAAIVVDVDPRHRPARLGQEAATAMCELGGGPVIDARLVRTAR